MRNKGRLLICMSLTLGLMGCYPSGSQVSVGEEDFEVMDENSGGQLDVSSIDDTDVLQGEWGCYDARLKQFDSEQVASIFNDKSEVINVQNYEDVQETIYHFKDESMINARVGNIHYRTPVEMGEKVAPWIFPFLYTDRYVLILYMVPLIFLYCDAPFIDNNQLFVLLRNKRTPWIIGQVLYIVLTSVIYFTTLTILPIVLHIRHITYMDDWGMVLGRMAISGTALVEGTAFTVSNHIVTYFTPQQAMFYAWMLSVLFGIFIGIMICMLNIITKHRIVAMVVAGFVVLFQTLRVETSMES